ncbi:sulfotransferase family 2 domain-containing protein [Microbulbifer sp. SAOS-129_SWC]|uniref:sulfotransferase family 2 domain-containing protein n=1 Tax=Microbulbifer sp. SAOS-129_SWC TaxID=3145235 RepID=UPI003216771A
MRKLILHYHLFKNAGSSIDEILKGSFGDSWTSFDKDTASAKILPAEMRAFIDENPQVRAVSSHQVMPPLPQGDFEVFPIVFLRHPLDRVRSAYLFEWKKQLGLTVPKGSFADYVREKLDSCSRGPIANYQVFQLSNTACEGEKPAHDSDTQKRLVRAQTFLAELPFFGLVERFQESLERMHFYLKYHFPDLKVVNRQVNTTQDTGKHIEERLLEVRQQLGEALYGELIDRNRQDLELYNFACKHFASVVPQDV